MREFFYPRSIVIVGVSDKPENMARSIVRNLHEFSFDGIIYQVGARGGTAFGRRIHKSIADIPDSVDLAVVLVPARFVPGVIEECGQKGIRRVVIESAGFGEYGAEGKALQEQVVAAAKRHGIRFIGPNCIGVMNLANGLVVPFTGLRDMFARGKVSIITQSGGVGLSFLNVLAAENLGLAKFASVGNKLNVNECDLLEYLVQDDATDIIVMYLEGIADGRRLMQIARSTGKPILVHKSNTGALARNIAASHTTSLSGDDAVASAAFEQVGLARFTDPDVMVKYLKVLPLPRSRGNRLAILSRSGGHAVIAADACEKAGFSLVDFPASFLREIEQHFRASVIKLTNPLDLGDLFDFEVYTRIIEATLQLPEVDAVVFLHTYLSSTEGEQSRALFRRIEELSARYGKPAVLCVATDNDELGKLRKGVPYPVFTEPEDAISALELMRNFKRDELPTPSLPDGLLDRPAIAAVLERCRREQRAPLLDEALTILRAAGVRLTEWVAVSSADEAAAAAERFGGQVAFKLIAAEASHKSDVGGVRLKIQGSDAARRAFDEMAAAARAAGVTGALRVLVQPMVKDGFEMIVGGRQDATFGPVVLCGIGGIYVEVFKDVRIRVAPFGEAEADDMVRRLRAFPLLSGVRGQKRRDTAAVRDCILSIARLVSAFPEITELDINPLMVLPEGGGAIAVDGRIGLR